ncbi:NosD domain-containing protein [Halococcus hamelinensis]|uniref:Periplasmic copper-binding protein n=1 Tax=Halococcus hamelinensis 100A6 TaxID=1132509 RepID=M0M3Q1_9EURY|nr:NosD domain-containing protein [Halococcus hamelinensis]EMA39254.1 periplasmic copper-binding protein [Halococcus hamelinensis 100A6]
MNLPRSSERVSNRRVTFLAVLVVVAAAFVGAGVAGAQSGTAIDSCTTIDSPGTYTLDSDLSADSTCIQITASDVTLDGDGHTIEGGSSGVGVEVSGDSTLSGVTVKNVETTGFTRGILFQNAEDGTIAGSTTTDATEGITLLSTDDTTVRGSTATDNALGVELRKASGNTITGTTANDNKYGLHIERGSLHNEFTGDTASGNVFWDFYSDRYSPGVDSDTTVSNLDMGSVTVDLSGTNVGARAEPVTGEGPSGREAVGTGVRTTDYGEGSDISLTIHYADGDTSGLVETSFALFSTDSGDSWSALDSSSVDAGANTVSATGVPHPATVAVFGSAGGSGSSGDPGSSGDTGSSNDSGSAATDTATTTATATATETATPTTTATATPTTTPTATATPTATPTATVTATETPTATRTATATTSTATAAEPSTATTTTATAADTADTTAVSGSGSTTTAGTERATATESNVSAGESGSNASTTSSSNGPGFGPLAALGALLAAAVLAVRRDQ